MKTVPTKLSKSRFTNKTAFAGILDEVNENITKTRTQLLKAIATMLQDETHFFKNDVFVTDEEERIRLKVYTVSKDTVELDDSVIELDLSDVGTDDLYSIADGLFIEKFI